MFGFFAQQLAFAISPCCRAIGLVVDDAIVVVDGVERPHIVIKAFGKGTPKDAALKVHDKLAKHQQ